MNTFRKVPAHVAIIMDGNGRWAERRGLGRIEGHRKGADSVRVITRSARKIGVERLTLYAFSEQNWGRPHLEVGALMGLLRDYLETERREIMDNGVRLRAIGAIEKLPMLVRLPLQALIRESANNTGMELCLALSYGGREELTAAMQRLATRVEKGELRADQIGTETIANELETGDVDLIIRTSGEQRLSNFLLWQMAYAEMYFVDELWPDFGVEEFETAIRSFGSRDRRFGLVA
ncbi:MAG: undecaprenyl diphosphate synthase [Myxococcota bacterium]